MDLAKNIKAKNLDKNEEGKEIPTVLNSDDQTLIDIARLIGVDLGTSLDMIENNLELIRLQEQARIAMFNEQHKEKNIEPANTNLNPSDIDAILQELITLNKEGIEEEMEQCNFLRGRRINPSRDLLNKNSVEVYSVKSPIRTVVRRRGKRKKKC